MSSSVIRVGAGVRIPFLPYCSSCTRSCLRNSWFLVPSGSCESCRREHESTKMFELPLLGTCPELESLDPTVIARIISEESPPRFPQQLPRFTFPAATPKGSSFSAGSPTPVTFCDFVGLGAVVGLFGLFSAVARRFWCAFP